ncbi:FAD-binding protein [Rubrobacter marinus]|uniref:FAD-binding protein n=1 Tax=Rubrobacter marinus TaxID=2653852 RepID=A0A6G8PW59_9ACTN|nr:FAD-dependent oxidoreductase [Rubrobacter marinus]QIN78440.1 FAD-binding protein [Rubrobacter marinus]
MAKIRRDEEAIRALTEVFEDRLRPPHPGEVANADAALAAVSPMSVEEVRWLAEVAARYSVPLSPLGAGTGTEPRAVEGSVIVRFDLMRRVRLPDGDEPWVEAEPGATWLQLEDALRARGRGIAVYPTSAPRATVGGWLATDGLGVGSFEHGRLRENVLSVDVVTRGGEMREVGGEELGAFFGPVEASGVVVAARIGTRRSDADLPVGAAFPGPDGVAGAVADLVDSAAATPLWHLAFVSPVMAAARGLRERYLLYGVYPRPRDSEDWWALRKRVIEVHGGEELDVREAWRVWGQRFFPVAPAQPPPHAARRLVTVAGLSQELESSRPEDAFQGTVSRSGDVLLLALGE